MKKLFPIILITLLAFTSENQQNWPGFRGPEARGVMDDANIPTEFDVNKAENLKWKTRIPGLGHSCPVIWDDKLFITTAISGNKEEYLKVGLYGDIAAVDDTTVHQFKVICLDKNSGDVIWEKLAHEGVPRTKRHTKASHANPTPVTNGKYVIAFFGSDGLYCYDMDGKLQWSKDLGVMNAGPYNAPNFEWGFANSPTIHKDRLVLQCDFLGESFIATYDLKTGKEMWKTKRDEISTWCTPTVINVNGQDQIIVNGYQHIGACNFLRGEPIWWWRIVDSKSR